MTTAITPHARGRAKARRARLPGPVGLDRLALVLAILLAFCGQSFVTATHLHLDEGAAPGAGQAHGTGPQLTRTQPPHSPADCPICRLAATAGHYLSPTPSILPEPAGDIALPSVAYLAASEHISRSHIWRSRGPPA